MSDTRVLLSRIAALRQRLEQGQPLPAGTSGTAAEPMSAFTGQLRQLESQVAAGTAASSLLDSSFRQLTETDAPDRALPRTLTARARRLLLQGQELLKQLRSLAGFFETTTGPNRIDQAPLTQRYRETVAMADTALRTVQAYPDSPSAQLQLCEGLAGILNVIDGRTAALKTIVEQRHREAQHLTTLADLFLRLEAGHEVELQPLVDLAEALLADVDQCAPLRFVPVEPPSADSDKAWLARVIAAHSLTVAQVVARLIRHDSEHRNQPQEPVLAALLFDVGMLRVPLDVYRHAGALDDDQKRLIEGHVVCVGDLLNHLTPKPTWLIDAAAAHHERLDGTGYPLGLREMQVPSLARLLAVCDTYVALCSPRPYRPAREPRTALTDTLLQAEKGLLDRTVAERLLQLSFYPVGSAVELADGAVGIVLATHMVRRDLNLPSRPVVMLYTDPQGQPLPTPRVLDLAECEDRSIVRSLPPHERRQLFGKPYPELV